MSTQSRSVRDDSGGVLTASAVMAAGTALSRVAGFVRAAMIAAALGISLHADVFTVANTIPNMLYILLAGGVFNAVLVPQLVRAMKVDADRGEAYANRVLTLSTVALAAATIALVVAAPAVMRVFLSPEWYTLELAAQRESLIDLARYCLVQVFFYGMFVLIGQVLNARGRFGPMMWAPIANNLIAIAVLALYLAVYGTQEAAGAYTTGQELLLGVGSTVGIAVQAALLLPYLRAVGVRIRPRFDFIGTGLARTLRLGLWTVLLVVVNQIAYTVVVRLATAGSTQAVTAGAAEAAGYTVYANAMLVMLVPHSVVTVSLATATLPAVSALAADGRLVDVGAGVVRSLRLALAVIVPFAFGLVVLGPPIATIVFGWGAAEGDTVPIALALAAFAPGLVLFTVHYLALRGFYAIEDTRTPFLVQCLIAAANIVLAIALTGLAEPRSYAAMLALAYTGSYVVGACLAIAILARRLGGLPGRELVGFLGRAVVAALPAAGAAWLTVEVAQRLGAAPTTNRLDALWLVMLGGLVLMAVFFALARLLRIREVDSLGQLLRGRLRLGDRSAS